MARPRRFRYRSGLEDKVIGEARAAGHPHTYEGLVLPYERPAKYKPDLILRNGIIVEIKGRFDSSDRSKHKMIQARYPDLDIRFLFSKPQNTLSRKSTTTYSMWCDRLGIPWEGCNSRKPVLPHRWTVEAPEGPRIRAILQLPERCLDEATRAMLEEALFNVLPH